MPIVCDIPEVEVFFSKFQALHTNVKVERHEDKGSHGFSRIEYITFSNKERKKKEMYHLFDTLESRYYLALYSLEEIRKDCENFEVDITDESKLETLKNSPNFKKTLEHQPVHPDFAIKCEYFIFAIESCLDIMGHIINIIYDLKINKRNVKTERIYNDIKSKQSGQDDFSISFLNNYESWIKEFKEIRNRMMHHQMIKFSSHGSYEPNKKYTYTKYCISVLNESDDEIQKNLPTYFDDVIKSYKNLRKNFYAKLNLII